jgi:hypothetical protein
MSSSVFPTGLGRLNALIKSYFFRRTNRGGLSKNGAKKSKLLGIARWLQRRIMWYSSQHGDALFLIEDDDVGCENMSGSDDGDDDSTISHDSNNSIYYTELEDDFLSSDDEEDDNDDIQIGADNDYDVEQ